MRGLMMDYPLTLTQFFERTRRLFHRKRMATRVPGVGLQWYSYADYADRVCRLAGALRGLGLQKGARVGTFAWNSHRHLEVYFAGKMVERLPRIRGQRAARIDYHHVIWSLVKKPGAFARYRWREELFPSLIFRRACDVLRSLHGERADAEYVRILYMAATSGL